MKKDAKMEKIVKSLEDADIIQTPQGYRFIYGVYSETSQAAYETIEKAVDGYYIQLALDYLGSAIRDNSRAEKISMGKAIENYGVNEHGEIDYPPKKGALNMTIVKHEGDKS